jgi:hypothetical protein
MHRFGYSLSPRGIVLPNESFPYVGNGPIGPIGTPYSKSNLGSPRSMPRSPFIVNLFTPSTNGLARRQYVHLLFPAFPATAIPLSGYLPLLPSGHILPRPLLRSPQPRIAWPGPARCVTEQLDRMTDNTFCRTIDWGSFHPAHVAHHRVVPQKLVHRHSTPAHLRCPVGDSLPRTSNLSFRRLFH